MNKYNSPKSARHRKMMMYAELIGNYKKWKIKSFHDNIIDTELGTGLFASDNDGAMTGTGRQTPWHYFYTGKKLSTAELDYIAKNGYQVFEGKRGIWRTTRGMQGVHFLYNALKDNEQEIRRCF